MSDPEQQEVALREPGRWALRHTDLATKAPRLSLAGARARARSAALSLAGRIRRPASEPSLRCLFLHGVYDDGVGAFRELLRALGALGRFVATDEVVRIASGAAELRGTCFHLSFDDGFDNHYRNAFPVLEELGVKAAFFVPSAFAGAGDARARELWWMPRRMPTRPLRWDWLREMQRAGHQIGSHTRTHARLAAISGDARRLEDEVAGSKRELEDALGAACHYLSWPFGTWDDVDARALDALERAGYAASFSAVRGRVRPGATQRFALPRHQFEADWPWPHVRYFALGGREP